MGCTRTRTQALHDCCISFRALARSVSPTAQNVKDGTDSCLVQAPISSVDISCDTSEHGMDTAMY
jgi:hypothetical protein